MPTERSIEVAVIRWATANDIPHMKLSLNYNTGWPDVMFLLTGGRPAFIEFKRPGKKPTPLQAYRLEILRSMGYDAIWCDNKEKAISWLEELLAARLSEACNKVAD